MKTSILILFSLFLTNQSLIAQAEQLESRVVRIEASNTASEPSLIFFEDGRLLHLHSVDGNTLKKFELVEISGDTVRVQTTRIGQFDDVSEIRVVPSTDEGALELFKAPTQTVNQSFTPTDYGTYENAQAQFKRLTLNMRSRSQCYQRAHAWAYEMWKESGAYTQKTFMFFTRKFIREYNYGWWFHVTPHILVNGTEFTLDRTFTDGPLTMQVWTSEFMPKDVTCPVVEKYSDYKNNQESQLCYHIKVPMYYYQPLQVEELEKGKFVTDWVASELAHARRAYR